MTAVPVRREMIAVGQSADDLTDDDGQRWTMGADSRLRSDRFAAPTVLAGSARTAISA